MSTTSPLLRSIVTGINGQFIKNKPIDYFRGVIDRFSKDDYMDMLDDFKISKQKRLSSYQTLNQCGYSKFQLYTNPHYEINLIEWKKGAKGLIHDHPPDGCVVKLIDGSLLEDRFVSSGVSNKINTIKHTQRNIFVPIHSFNKTKTHSYFIEGIHSIENINNDKSYSLHFYAPPNYVSETYYPP